MASPWNTWACSSLSPGTAVAAIDPRARYSYGESVSAAGFVLADRDGTLTGTPGAWIVADSPFVLPGPAESMHCGPLTTGNVHVCSPGFSAYVMLSVDDTAYVFSQAGRGGEGGRFRVGHGVETGRCAPRAR